MNKDIRKYRKTNPRCIWCRYYKFNSKCFGEYQWEECELKDKYLNPFFHKIRAKLCKYYKLKKEKRNER